MCLNLPQTIPIPCTPVQGKIVSQETSPWCQNGGALVWRNGPPVFRPFAVVQPRAVSAPMGSAHRPDLLPAEMQGEGESGYFPHMGRQWEL